MTPEQRARQEIDLQLQQCGWIVQGYRDMNISAGLGVAVREFRLKSGLADYLLYADCKALGVIEAKPEGHLLTGVETQSVKCLDSLPEHSRQLVLDYYQGEKQAMIDRRKTLADALGIPMNALRLRVNRIRNQLQNCVKLSTSRTGPARSVKQGG